MPRGGGGGGLGVPLVASLLLHVAVAAGLVLVFLRAPEPVPTPPVYRVNLVAAPPGPRAIGEVDPSNPAPPQTEAPPPPRAEREPSAMPPAPTRAARRQRTPPKAATPLPIKRGTKRPPANAPTPAAGGGPTGGHGADVANVRTEGIDFPYPGYLNNIVRQIALRFHPDNPNAPLHADVFFLIHRDGSITGFRFQTRSGVYGFDLEAQGAVEAAASARAFGPLPDGFTDDVLPVIFSFDPRLIH